MTKILALSLTVFLVKQSTKCVADIYKLLEEKGEIKLDAKKYEECLKRDLK